MTQTEPPTASKGRGYPPMSRQGWENRIIYLRQALAKLLNPSAPEPDIKLLVAETHGPFTKAWTDTEPEGQFEAVFFTVKNRDRGPRWCPPEVFLMLSLLLAFGGGLSVNGDRGWGYLRPWGGNLRHTLGRLLKNPRRGRTVRQSKRVDHHNQHPQYFTTTTAPRICVGPESRIPTRDREYAIQTALLYFSLHHDRSDIPVTRSEFEAVLRDAFRLIDAYYAEEELEAAE